VVAAGLRIVADLFWNPACPHTFPRPPVSGAERDPFVLFTYLRGAPAAISIAPNVWRLCRARHNFAKSSELRLAVNIGGLPIFRQELAVFREIPDDHTLAVVERLPGHTEVMGGFASLALELGYDTHLLFDGGDRFHMVEYLRTRIPIGADHIHDWSQITNPDWHFDVILLNTSYVWLDYGPLVQQWNANRCLIVVHHHPEDIELNPHGASVYLTPAAGIEKWIFPLYSKPSGPVGLGPENDSLCLRDATELPTLISIGTFEGKDIAGAVGYMKAGGKLVHYDRHRCSYFPANDGLYTQHPGLDGLQLMTSLAQQKKPIFLWLPIVPTSEYLVCRFTGALIIGVEMNCVMVMPERLRKLYGFPEDAVITYDTSVTDAGCLEKLRASPVKQHERRRQLWIWAAERWNKNLAIFQSLSGHRSA
jgi:hypothetical protein